MKAAKATNKKFTFTHEAPSEIKGWRHSVLWLLRIPANDILFGGIVMSLGMGGLWVACLFITPQEAPSQVPVVLINAGEGSYAGMVLLWIFFGILGGLFWIGAAILTHSAVLRLVRFLHADAYLLAVKMTLLCLGWLPIIGLFALNSTRYSGQVLVGAASLVLIGSVLFFVEHLLQNYWQEKVK